jgi:predicted negative regulator of RcsB-dependent stress response
MKYDEYEKRELKKIKPDAFKKAGAKMKWVILGLTFGILLFEALTFGYNNWNQHTHESGFCPIKMEQKK